MAALVSAIAAVALVVGGVGVMNIMLVSVKERVREIGVRLAVGARQGDILRQFLIEAVLICLFGGVLGVLSALGVGALSSLLSLGVPFLFTPGPVLAALACSSAIGLGSATSRPAMPHSWTRSRHWRRSRLACYGTCRAEPTLGCSPFRPRCALRRAQRAEHGFGATATQRALPLIATLPGSCE